jgi:hypothetical protein
MKYLLIIVGMIVLLFPLVYFVRIIHFLSMGAYRFTAYGQGMLAGNILLLLLGAFLLFLGLKKKKKGQGIS